MLDVVAKNDAFQLKGSLFTLTVLQLVDPEPKQFETQLAGLIRQAPKFFQYAPIVLDLRYLKDKQTPLDFMQIKTLLRQFGMIPVGIRAGNKEQQAAATQAELAILSQSKTETSAPTKSKTATKESKPTAEESTNTKATLLITKPVRSGQQIYAQGGDLIITASVSEGAELLADGNIHIYGTLRGRALAGIQGNTNARIFCRQLDAELVSIAGSYIVSEESLLQPPQNNFYQIFLEHDKLQIQTL